MSPDQLAFYSGWASIAGLAVSLVSLAYVRGIQAHIIRIQRRKRVLKLIDNLITVCANGDLLQSRYRGDVEALKRNLPVRVWYRYTSKGRIVLEIHRLLDAGDQQVLGGALVDLQLFLEDV